MHKLVILIEATQDDNKFERLWPLFLRWAEQMPGLQREVTTRVAHKLYGPSDYRLIHELYFDSAAAAREALDSYPGTKAGQTLQRITSGNLSLYLADHLEDTLKNIQSVETTRLSAADLVAFMQKHDIAGELLHLDVPTPTVEAAAQAVDAETDQIVKSLLFVVRGDPVLAIAHGTRRIDYRAVAGAMNVGRRRVRLAGAEEVLAMTGYPVGAVPPFGHRRKLHTLLDPGVLANEVVYAGGGENNALVRLASKDILRVTRAKQVELLEPPQPPEPDAG